MVQMRCKDNENFEIIIKIDNFFNKKITPSNRGDFLLVETVSHRLCNDLLIRS